MIAVCVLAIIDTVIADDVKIHTVVFSLFLLPFSIFFWNFNRSLFKSFEEVEIGLQSCEALSRGCMHAITRIFLNHALKRIARCFAKHQMIHPIPARVPTHKTYSRIHAVNDNRPHGPIRGHRIQR